MAIIVLSGALINHPHQSLRSWWGLWRFNLQFEICNLQYRSPHQPADRLGVVDVVRALVGVVPGGGAR